ncbi:hypothetical protein [Streptosporangium minutum]|uniref:Uncharacterized protein n=1 Tax=Streptosporangium minutum TaxID=569862 RepID=A0A243RP45_9ACTN|nr:hypothetical protein [Streptosporangium minutum]OUC96732.1 hypothetical protein CA984_13910 [Streptosporangium minutum]
MAAELRGRVPEEITETQLHYLIFTLIYAGQLTTDPSLGFLLARVFDADRAPAAEITMPGGRGGRARPWRPGIRHGAVRSRASRGL